MIGILAIFIALIAIIAKILNHLNYLDLVSNSPKISDFWEAFSPTFFRDREEYLSDSDLKKVAKRIKVYLAIFYFCILIFFVYVSFSQQS